MLKELAKGIKTYETEIIMFLLFFIVYSYFITGFHSANEGSALALTKAIVDERTLVIDDYKDLASVDVSFYNNHFYSDKDIGRALLGIPVYIADKFLTLNSDQILFSMELMTAFFSAASVVLFYRFLPEFKVSKGHSLILAFTYGFGTILFTFSKTFFAHPYSAFFNLFALVAMLAAIRKGDKKYLIFSGIFSGISFLVEYTNAFVIAFIFLYGLYKLRPKRIRVIYFLLPFIAISSLTLVYNYFIFKNPLTTTYNYQYSYGNIETSYFRLDFLKEGLNGLLFSSWRGLFYYSPVLLLSVIGFLYWLRDEKDKMLPAVLLLSFAAILLFYAATPAWRGGNSYGPRYLVAVMPFIVLPMWKTIEVFKKHRLFWVFFAVLLGYSIVFSAVGSFIGPSPPENLTNPFWQSEFPLLLSGFLDSYLFQLNKTSLYAVAIVSAFLFVVVLKNFILKDFFKNIKSRKKSRRPSGRTFVSRKEFKQLFVVLIFLLFVKILTAAFVIYLINTGRLVPPPDFHDSAFLYATSSKWDAYYYVKIAMEGYPPGPVTGYYAFEPLYPFLISSLTFLTRDFYISSALITNIFYFLTLVAFYYVARLYFDGRQSLIATLLMGLFPLFVTYGFVSYSDVVFLFFSVSSFYFFQRKEYFSSGILGALAASTRSIGLLLTPIYLVMIYLRRSHLKLKSKEDLFSLLAPAAAFLLISVYFFYQTGDLFAFFDAHRLWGTGIGSVLDLMNALRQYTILTNFERIAYIIFFFAAAVALLKIDPLLTLYCLVFLVLFVNLKGIATLSVARYSLAAWPVFLVFGKIRNRSLLAIFIIVLFVLAFQSTYFHMTDFWM